MRSRSKTGARTGAREIQMWRFAGRKCESVPVSKTVGRRKAARGFESHPLRLNEAGQGDSDWPNRLGARRHVRDSVAGRPARIAPSGSSERRQRRLMHHVLAEIWNGLI